MDLGETGVGDRKLQSRLPWIRRCRTMVASRTTSAFTQKGNLPTVTHPDDQDPGITGSESNCERNVEICVDMDAHHNVLVNRQLSILWRTSSQAPAWTCLCNLCRQAISACGNSASGVTIAVRCARDND
jgi:hypothetical protein